MTSPLFGPVRAAARSRWWRAALVVLLAVGGLGGWWLSVPHRPGYRTGDVHFASGVPRGVYDLYGQLLSGVVDRSMPGVRLRMDHTQGSLDNLERVVNGQDDFAISAADAVTDYRGPGKDRLRAVARLYDDYLQLIVPADSPVQRTADLKGLRVGVGEELSGVNLIAGRLLSAAGLDLNRDIVPKMLDISDATDQLRSGRIDAFFWSGGLPTAAVTDLANQFPIRIVPLGDLAEPLYEIEGGGSDAYRAATIPADAYPKALPSGVAVPTVAVPNLLVTRDDTDSGLVEGMTKAVIDSRDAIGAKVHAAQLVDLRTAVYTSPLPLAEGARRYYLSVKP